MKGKAHQKHEPYSISHTNFLGNPIVLIGLFEKSNESRRASFVV